MAKTVMILLLWFATIGVYSQKEKQISLQAECAKTLEVLGEALMKMQNCNETDSNYGGLKCPESGLYHSRAAEAVYPLAVLYKISGNAGYKKASIELGNWLIKQQGQNGEWLETPWTWTGTTADQLLMMSLSYPILENSFTKEEKQNWKNSIIRAADYLVRVMNPDFATINYCATTPACLATTNLIFPDHKYVKKAYTLARMVLSKMNDDGFIEGEAARVGNVKYGVDFAYEVDMSLWGLELYARLLKDSFVHEKVKASLANHLPFVYPNGMIDGSWGTRCYKWTTFGSKTADGCQILFGLFAKDDARYRTAAIRNLEYLRTMIKDELIGSGPHYFRMGSIPPCNYSTFARAKNLALAVELGDKETGDTPALPSDNAGMFYKYNSVNITLARTENIMTTISAYQYIDLLNWGEGRYSQFPSGGSACNIWIKDLGLFQTSSPTRYVRGEIIHMPEIKDSIKCLTPRIEYFDSTTLFTNLYEHNGIMSADRINENDMHISVTGELKNEKNIPGGVSYKLTHNIKKASIQKIIRLTYHDKFPAINIVEPVIYEEGMEIIRLNNNCMKIKYKNKEIKMTVSGEFGKIDLEKDKEKYWQPFPAIKCIPINIMMPSPTEPFKEENYRKEIMVQYDFN